MQLSTAGQNYATKGSRCNDSTFELYRLQRTIKSLYCLLNCGKYFFWLKVQQLFTYARPFLERVTVYLCARSVVVSWLCRVVQEL